MTQTDYTFIAEREKWLYYRGIRLQSIAKELSDGTCLEYPNERQRLYNRLLEEYRLVEKNAAAYTPQVWL